MKTATATLAQLKLNPEINPRHVPGKESDDGLEGTMAQIEDKGFIDAITVRPERGGRGKPTGAFEIIDGGKRFRSLKRLVLHGKWKKDGKIPIAIHDVDLATAIDMALALNFEREALSPADEAIGFTRLLLAGKPVESIAAHYAVTERLVKQRIAIGSLPAPILDALRAGKIDVGTAQMFTQFPAERALKTFRDLDKKKSLRRYDVEEALTDGTISGLDRRCVFVGAADYEAAGGIVSRDLFGSNDLWNDEKLLNSLFEAKLESKAQALKDEGWSFVDIIRKNPYQIDSWGRSKSNATRDLSKEEAAELKSLQKRLAEIEKRLEEIDDDPDALYDDALNDEQDVVEGRIAALQAPVFSDRQKAKAGAVIIAAEHGQVRIERGLIKPGARKAATSETDADESEEEMPHETPAEVERQDYSEALTKMLEEVAQKATKVAMVMHKPMLTYRMGLAARIMAALNNGHGSPFDCHHRETVSGDTYDELRDAALKPFDRGDDDGEADIENESFAAVLARLELMSPQEIINVEAFLAADLFKVSSLKNLEVQSVITLIDPDMATEGFVVTAEFLGKLNKQQLLAIAAEINPAERIAASIKKSDLVAALEPGAVASGWKPAVLRTPSYRGPGSNAWIEARDAKLAVEAVAKQPAEPEPGSNLQAAE